MRTLPRTVQPTCPGHHSQKGILLQLILNKCREGHRGHVWLCLMILGVLCRSTWASEGHYYNLQICLNYLQLSIEKSDAMLYAPSVDEITEKCECWSLFCYMLELKMVLTEEKMTDKEDSNTNCIFTFSQGLEEKTNANTGRCPPCEATPLKNSTIFLENLKSLLNILTVQMDHCKM